MKIIKKSITDIGFGFVSAPYLREGEDEYSVRFSQVENKFQFRNITSSERAVLISNGNISTDWDKVHVTDTFNPNQILNSKFYGLVRIGDMSASSLEYRDLDLPTGIYNSTIINYIFYINNSAFCNYIYNSIIAVVN